MGGGGQALVNAGLVAPRPRLHTQPPCTLRQKAHQRLPSREEVYASGLWVRKEGVEHMCTHTLPAHGHAHAIPRAVGHTRTLAPHMHMEEETQTHTQRSRGYTRVHTQRRGGGAQGGVHTFTPHTITVGVDPCMVHRLGGMYKDLARAGRARAGHT